MEAIERQEVCDVGPLVGIAERGNLSELTVLGCELGGRGDLDQLNLAQRALRKC